MQSLSSELLDRGTSLGASRIAQRLGYPDNFIGILHKFKGTILCTCQIYRDGDSTSNRGDIFLLIGISLGNTLKVHISLTSKPYNEETYSVSAVILTQEMSWKFRDELHS